MQHVKEQLGQDGMVMSIQGSNFAIFRTAVPKCNKQYTDQGNCKNENEHNHIAPLNEQPPTVAKTIYPVQQSFTSAPHGFQQIFRKNRKSGSLRLLKKFLLALHRRFAKRLRTMRHRWLYFSQKMRQHQKIMRRTFPDESSSIYN